MAAPWLKTARDLGKTLLLLNCVAQMLKIWYVAFPCGNLSRLFKWCPAQGTKMALHKGVLGLNCRYT